MASSLTSLFAPRGIALVGASGDPAKRSGKPLRYLMHWFDGPLYPVNPNRDTVEGLTAYDSVTDVSSPVDLAIVTLPAPLVVDVVEECGESGIDHAIVISAGFAEAHEDGRSLQAELSRVASRTGIRVVGPNSFGVINCENGMVASIMTPDMGSSLPDGPAAVISQSGGVVTTLLDAAQSRSVGVRHLVSSGNEMDVDSTEYVSHMAAQPDIDVVATYVEGLDDGRRFMTVADEARGRETPIVALKGGRAEHGARSALSHTASMTGNYDVFEGACEQTGVITVESAHELLDCCQLFQGGHYDARRIGAVSDSGGGAVSIGDHLAATGLALPEFTTETRKRLAEMGGSRVHPINPFDLAAAIDIDQYEEMVRLVGTDPNVDVLVWYSAWNGEDAVECAEALERGASNVDVPVVVVWPVPRQRTNGGKAHLERHGIPVFPTVDRAISTLGRMQRYRSWVHGDRATTGVPGVLETDDADDELPRGDVVTEVECKQLLRDAGVSVPAEALVESASDAVERAREFGSTVVMKVVSPDIPHRSEHRLVEVGVPIERVSRTYTALLDRAGSAVPDATVEGVLVQEYVRGPPSVEVLVGTVDDPVFGPTVMVAPGGVCAESSDTTVHRVAPFDTTTAVEMIEALGLDDLGGERVSTGRDRLATVVRTVGEVAAAHPEIEEFDCNPVIVTEDDAIVVDALVRT